MTARNQNLDALRGLAILMVLGHHLQYFTVWTRAGWAGVDLFFVLSGYLISGLLFSEWQRTGAIDFPRFFIRRGFKIYPAFYCLLGVSIVGAHLLPGVTSYPVTWRSALAEASFTQNYFGCIWGQTWSLAVEEHFYLLLPLVLWLMYRNNRNRDPFRALPNVFFAVATLEIALRILVACISRTPSAQTTFLMPTHLRLDGLLFGVLIRYYREFQPDKFREMATSKGGLVMIAIGAAMTAVLSRGLPVMHTLGFTVVYFACGFLLARSIDYQPSRIASFLLRPLAFIGYYSYSIYLWHGWIARLLPHSTLASFFGCILAAVALGVVMGKLIEYPALQLRDRLYPRESGLMRHAVDAHRAGCEVAG